jgi:hypothetical protein
MKKRTITLLSSGRETKIDPAEWLGHGDAKEFDATSTSILRTLRHRKNEGQFLVYGMRAKEGTKIAEAYEFAIDAAELPAAIAAVAKHCGVESLKL